MIYHPRYYDSLLAGFFGGNNGEFKDNILTGEFTVNSGQALDFTFKDGLVLGVEQDFGDTGTGGLDANALSNDFSGVNHVL